VAFDDENSLSGNGGHVKPDAKILLVFQLIKLKAAMRPIPEPECSRLDVTPLGAGRPAPDTPAPVRQPDRMDNRVALQPVSAYPKWL
jgi:hypothetical protein